MRVLVLPSDRGGCGYTRLIWPAEELQRQGCDIEIADSISAVWERREDGPDRLVSVKVEADVVVWQRVYTGSS